MNLLLPPSPPPPKRKKIIKHLSIDVSCLEGVNLKGKIQGKHESVSMAFSRASIHLFPVTSRLFRGSRDGDSACSCSWSIDPKCSIVIVRKHKPLNIYALGIYSHYNMFICFAFFVGVTFLIGRIELSVLLH